MRCYGLAPASFASYVTTLDRVRRTQAGTSELRRGGHDSDLLPHGPARPAETGPDAAGRTGADPRGLGRRGAGRDPDRPPGRRGDLRHRRQPSQTRLPPIAGHPTRDGFPHARLCRPDPQGDRRRGRRPGAQFAHRRVDRGQPLRTAPGRTVPGTGQDRSLGPAAGRRLPARREVLRDCLGPHDGPRAGGGWEPAGRSAAAAGRQDPPAASVKDVPHPARCRCLAAHGPRRAYRQGRHPGGDGTRTGQVGADTPRGRHVI